MLNMMSATASSGGRYGGSPVRAAARPAEDLLGILCHGSQPSAGSDRASCAMHSPSCNCSRDWAEFFRAAQRWRNQNARILDDCRYGDRAVLDPEVSSANACSLRSLLVVYKPLMPPSGVLLLAHPPQGPFVLSGVYTSWADACERLQRYLAWLTVAKAGPAGFKQAPESLSAVCSWVCMGVGTRDVA